MSEATKDPMTERPLSIGTTCRQAPKIFHFTQNDTNNEMTQAPTKYERYLADYRELDATGAANGPQWLRRLREHGRDRFSELGLPTARKGNEKWKYTNVTPIANSEFARPEEAPPDGISIVDLRDLV